MHCPSENQFFSCSRGLHEHVLRIDSKKLNIWRDFWISGEAIYSALASLLAPTVPRPQQHDFDFKWPRCLNVIFTALSAIIMLGTPYWLGWPPNIIKTNYPQFIISTVLYSLLHNITWYDPLKSTISNIFSVKFNLISCQLPVSNLETHDEFSNALSLQKSIQMWMTAVGGSHHQNQKLISDFLWNQN